MTLSHAFVVFGIDKRVVPVCLWQRLFATQQRDHLFQFFGITTLFERKFIIPFEPPGKLRLKEALIKSTRADSRQKFSLTRKKIEGIRGYFEIF